MNSRFFQRCWSILGTDVFNQYCSWLNNGAFLDLINQTLSILIPEKDKLDSLKDLRPIALCNILYNIVAKVLANCHKKILPSIISPMQYVFVPGRLIINNILITFELIHSMNNKGHGMEELVESILTPYDVSLMYKIPIRLQKGPDQLIWHWSSNGLYMVKSGQELAFDLYSNSDSFEVDGPWLRIWSGQFPLKIKDFTWRCLKNFIPTCARDVISSAYENEMHRF
ncbi:hypothetical protein GOBAR_DD10161 [Gossypium barbadense]|nr:hypothetical protein GOBAR_DD10161 [Gossypium barbadense]